MADLQGRSGIVLYHASCLPAGMPNMMSAGRFEYVITPETKYIHGRRRIRRIFTDERPWPYGHAAATYQGFSIAEGIDENAMGLRRA